MSAFSIQVRIEEIMIPLLGEDLADRLAGLISELIDCKINEHAAARHENDY